MRKDSRISRVLHILIHMGANNGSMTSVHIAQMLSTNPVVVRRIMGGLRDVGYVQTIKGRGGGWMLACPLKNITLLDIYNIFSETSLFAIGLTDEHSDCFIEKNINEELGAIMNEATELMLGRFSEITLDLLNKR